MSFSGRRLSLLRPSGNRRLSTSKDLSDNELRSETHRQFRAAHEGHRPHAGLDASRASTGVVWCTERASEHGYAEDPTGWANLGQGAPEADDDIEGSFPRPTSIPISSAAREYGPTAGIKPLRAAVARLYNEHYRQGKDSQYTWENVCIVPGGRAGLIRIAAILGNSYLSFPIPDYSAYSEMLTLFKNIAPIPLPLSKDDHYRIHPDKVAEEIARGTQVLLTSNPRNPTGHFVPKDELAEIQDLCRDRATLILDEFYGGYNYTTDCDGTTISGAANVIDVDKDDVLLIDGLTKRFRLPGWRIAWIVGPKEFITALGSAGSYLDGGANVPFQEAAIPMLEPSLVHQEMKALQLHFKEKRDYVLKRLYDIGFRVQDVPDATFYIWLDLTTLDPPLPPQANISDGLNFFNALLKEKVIVVPGIFFDLNPAKRRDLFDSPCHHFVRLSYGPKMEVLEMGLDGIERVIKQAREMAGADGQWEDEVAVADD
ncbi:Pyridoxal phosphate-dependent transferase major region subdomain 2 [Penicillium sp. DV-2018c]|nr:Pyridoxal phosphate-dependent transferase major region subdomain 2 [Penicillium sp. DV-2018c]